MLVDRLYEAIMRRDVSLVCSLLDKGTTIDVNEQDSFGDTTLSLACSIGNELIVSLLIERGAAVNHKNIVRILLCDLFHSLVISFISFHRVDGLLSIVLHFMGML